MVRIRNWMRFGLGLGGLWLRVEDVGEGVRVRVRARVRVSVRVRFDQ